MRFDPFRFALPTLLLLVACGDDSEPLEPTYENVEALVENSCGASSMSCHGGARGNARLNFGIALAEGDIRSVLVDQPSCEYDAMLRVQPGSPDSSWLMEKLAGEFDEEGLLLFEPDPAWVAPEFDGVCPLIVDGELSFGYLMPQNVGHPSPLPEEELELIRAWILAGAPGPGEPVPGS